MNTIKTDADFERSWALMNQDGNPKVTKEVARKVWDAAYPKPLPGQRVDWDRPHTLSVEDLREIQRLIGGAISLIESGSIRMVQPKLIPYDLILAGKWGIKKLKP